MSEKRIAWANPDGSISVLVPDPNVAEFEWRKDIPAGTPIVETTVDKLPPDRLFRKAWTIQDGQLIECPIKAKTAAHEIRRQRRESAFAPHDSVIAKAIPGKAEAAEAERQKIREADAAIQAAIDACQTVDELRKVLGDQ